MTLTLHVPVWLLWVLGVPLGLLVLLLAVFGLFMLFNMPRWG